MQDLLNISGSTPLPLDALIVNLLLTVILTTILAWFYTKFGQSLSNRSRFAQNLPALALTTVLIISVVKSSLALSLGLVGALSIVRFRTAIKEPEELVFLFMAISIGLGMGADQRWPTVIAIAIILAFLYLRTLLDDKVQKNNLFFNISSSDRETTLKQISDLLLAYVTAADLRRVDHNDTHLQATYLVSLPHDEALNNLLDALRQQMPAAEFTFVEQGTTLGG